MTRAAAAGVILAGGQSIRFGSDKAAALLDGRPLLEWVASALAEVCEPVLIVRAQGQVLPPLGARRHVRFLEDLYRGRGPLAGLVTAFSALRSGLCFAVSCDAPLLQPPLVRALVAAAADHDAVCPVVGGFPQPLVACYRAETCLSPFRASLDAGDGRIMAALESLDVRRVDEAAVRETDPDLLSFLNANTPAALAEIALRLGA